MNTDKLFNKNFSLLIIGQIISILGNSILRFALPLYILNKTNSATIFGSVLALSLIPTIILSPFGGILCDRISRKNIMVFLDFTTSFVVLIFTLFAFSKNYILNIIFLLIILSIIQSFYQPAVTSSIPFLANENNLVKANAVVNQVNSLSNLIGPIVAGIVYGFFGIMPILIISCISFSVSALVELIMKIPFNKQEISGSLFLTIKKDIKDSISFVINDKPSILKTMVLIALFNLFLSSMVVVGLPFIINILLNINSTLYGISQGVIGSGAIIGGFIASIFSKKLKIENTYYFLFFISLSLLPIAIALFLNFSPIISYIIITISATIFMIIAVLTSINLMCFIQISAPNHMLGKIMAYVLTISMCAEPIGNAMYGFLFNSFKSNSFIVVFFSVFSGIIISLSSKKIFSSANLIKNSNSENL